MKRLLSPILAFSLIPVLSGCGEQPLSPNEYVVKGLLETDDPSATVTLTYSYAYENSRSFTETTTITDNKFEFRGTLDEPAMGRLLLNREGEEQETLSVVVEPGVTTFTINGKLSDALVEPEPRFRQDRKKWDEASRDQSRQSRDIAISFIKENPDSWFALLMLYEQYAVGVTPEHEFAKEVFDYFTPEIQNTRHGKRIQQKLAGRLATQVGEIAPDFTLEDTQGKMITLSDLRGQYVFLDFWASWCGSCRAENPNVLRAYNELINENFMILGISVDNNNEGGRTRWLKAVDEDGMPWTQLINNDGSENEVANIYGISAVPATFLLDPQGKIVAKDLRGERLAELIRSYIEQS